MGIRNALRLIDSSTPSLTASAGSGYYPGPDPDDLPSYPVSIGPAGEFLTTFAPGYVDRATALSVPAVKRSRDLIANTVASADIVEIVNGERRPPRSFLAQPDPKNPRQVTMAKTVADLFWEGESYWLVTSRFREDNRPATARHIPYSLISTTADEYGDLTSLMINGVPQDLENVIAFEALSGGILKAGASAIRTAVAMDRAVRTAANNPIPLVYLRNLGVKLTQDQIDELMAVYDATVTARNTPYIPRDIEVGTVGWSPEQLGLNSARAAQAVEISRLTGIPAWYLAADSGDSMTYSNNTQARMDLYSFALAPYAIAVESRLSMDDVTGRGTRVELDFTPFLRMDPELRARLYSQLVPLGVMTVEQAAAMEPLVP